MSTGKWTVVTDKRTAKGNRPASGKAGGRQQPQQQQQQQSSKRMALPPTAISQGGKVKMAEAEVTRVAAAVQRLSRQLLAQKETLRRTVFASVTSFIERELSRTNITGPVTCIRVIGLGIGAFSRDARTPLLQMALLVALRQHARDVLRNVRRRQKSSATTEESPPSVAADVQVVASYYDPVAQHAHKQCCKALEVAVEGKNLRGAYTAANTTEDGSGSLLILLMPRCPWPVLANSVAASWPVASSTEEDALLPLRRVLWITNDLRNAPSEGNGYTSVVLASAAKLSSVFTFQALLLEKKQSGGGNFGGNDDDGAEDSDPADMEAGESLKRISHSDLTSAFHGVTAWCLDPKLEDAAIFRTLQAVSADRPAIITKAGEMR